MAHAEMQSSYMPRPGVDQLAEAKSLADSINATKVLDPTTGAKIDDQRVDALIARVSAIAARPENMPEAPEWTAPQRIVWRYSRLPHNKRLQVLANLRFAPEMKAYAIVNAGRWIVLCPSPGCNSAQHASWLDKRFWCVDCENRMVQGSWIEVVWPQDHLAIEDALQVRPLHAQHWLPGETRDDLTRQDQEAIGRNN